MGDRYGYIGIETLLNFCENSKDHSITPNDFMRMKRVREPKRKTGKWIDTGSGQECDQCHEIQYGYDSGRRFCANCGARMEGEQDDYSR